MSLSFETDVLPLQNKDDALTTTSISGVVKPTTRVFNPSVPPFVPSVSTAFVSSPAAASSASLTISAEPFRPSPTFIAPVMPQGRSATTSTWRFVAPMDVLPTADLTSNVKPNHVPARLTYSLLEMVALDTLEITQCPEGVPDFLNPETEACISFFQRDVKPKRREGVQGGREFKKEKDPESANSNRSASRNAGQGFGASGSSSSSRKKGPKGEKENSAGRSDKEMERIRLERYRQLDLELGRSTARPGHSSRPSAPVQYADIFGRAIDPLNPTPATLNSTKSFGDRGDSRDRYFSSDRGGRRGGERFGSSQGNSRHGHGGPRPDDRLLSDDEVRPLENSENKWTPDSLLKSKSAKSASRKGDKKQQKGQLDYNAKSTDGETSEADSDVEAEIARAKLIKSLTALLNKLAADNLPQIVERTVTLLSEITLVSTLKKVARLLFEKAISSYAFADIYAKYLNALIAHYAPVSLPQSENENQKDNTISSSKTIPVFFEDVGDNETSSPARISLVEQVLEECYGQLAMLDASGLTNLSLSISKEDLDESFEHAASTLATRLRMRVEGTIALIGALAKEDIVPLNHIMLYISILLLNRESITLDEADCLRLILQSVGFTLDKVAKNSNSRLQLAKNLSKATNVLGSSGAHNSASISLAIASPFAKTSVRIGSENGNAAFSVDAFHVSPFLLHAYQRKARGKALYEFYTHVSPVITNLLNAGGADQHKTLHSEDENEDKVTVDLTLIYNLMSLETLPSRLNDIYRALEEIIARVKLVSYRHACLLMDLTELRSKNWNPNAIVRRPLNTKSSGSSSSQSSTAGTLSSKNVSTSKLVRSDATKHNSSIEGHSTSFDSTENLLSMVFGDGTIGSLVSVQSNRNDNDEVDYVDESDYEKVRAGDMITPLDVNLNIPSTGLVGGKTVDPGSLELIIGKIGSPAKQGKASGALAALSPNSKSRSKRQNYALTAEGVTNDENTLPQNVYPLENEGGEHETGETELQRAMSRTKLKRNTSSFASTSSSSGSFALNTASTFAGEPITFERTPTNSNNSINATNAFDVAEHAVENGLVASIATHISDVGQDQNDVSTLEEEETLPEFRVKRDVYVMIDEFVDARLPNEISMCLADLFQKAPKEFTPYAQEQWKKFQAESIAAALLGEKVMSHGVLHPLVFETFRLLMEKQQLDHFSLSRGIVLACEVVEDIKHDNPLIDRDIAAIVIKCIEYDLVDWYNVTEPLMCAANDTASEVLDNPDYDRLSTQYLEMKSACIVFTAFLKELIMRPALFKKVLSRSRKLHSNQDDMNSSSSDWLANALCNTTLLSPIMNQVSRAFVVDEFAGNE